MRHLILLGPQRRRPTVAEAMDRLGTAGQVAVVTAGWQEREAEDDELTHHLGRPRVNLALHARSEDVFAENPGLLAALQEREDRLRELRDLYRLRLHHALAAARELLRRDGEEALLAPEREDAVAAVRALDAHHRRRVAQVEAELAPRLEPEAHPALAHHRREVAEVFAGCGSLVVAGGHVAVLRHRLALFGLRELLESRPDLPVFAWSAGAMVLAEEIVLFHDSPPQGPGNAEVMAPGVGLAAGVLPLPDASRRLRLGDPVRVGLLARRFAPLRPLALDGGAWLHLEAGRPAGAMGVRWLTEQGNVEPLVVRERV